MKPTTTAAEGATKEYTVSDKTEDSSPKGKTFTNKDLDKEGSPRMEAGSPEEEGNKTVLIYVSKVKAPPLGEAKWCKNEVRRKITQTIEKGVVPSMPGMRITTGKRITRVFMQFGRFRAQKTAKWAQMLGTYCRYIVVCLMKCRRAKWRYYLNNTGGYIRYQLVGLAIRYVNISGL